MRDPRFIARFLVRCLPFWVPLECFAYIDPNVGGWLFQLLFPVLVAIGGAWMVLRQRIGGLWKRLFGRKNAGKDSG